MKKVLILCDLFPPAFGPRMGYLCKYLTQSEWTPTVVTERVAPSHFQFLANVCEVHEVDYYTSDIRFIRKLQWICIQILSLLFDYKSHKIYKEAEKLISRNHFNLILCSTYRTFPLPAAESLAEKYGLPLIVDLRDIIEQYSGEEFISHRIPDIPILRKYIINSFKNKNIKTRNRILEKAACVTSVSDWHINFLRQYNKNINLIFNGYDPDIFHPEPVKTSKFIITYTGRVLSTAMRDPSLLFEALRRLTDKGCLSPTICRVLWYVDRESWNIIHAEAEKFNVEDYMEMKGYVTATDIPKILNGSSVLLLLTNKSSGKGPKGVMTTKLFESLAVRKPILCVRNDEGVIEKVLKESNAGIAAETADEVCTFLSKEFISWKEKGYTMSAAREDLLERFSRKEQASQFIQLFETYNNQHK